MNKMLKKTMMAAALMTAAGLPQLVQAESTSVTGGGALSTAARIDMSIVIPRFLQFQVGTAGGTIDVVTFNVPAASVGAGGAGIAGVSSGGAVTVRANTGQVTITPTTNAGGLGNGGGQFINFNTIATTSSDVNVPAPALVNGAGVGALTVLSAAPVTNRTATWTYNYNNVAIPNPGTYGAGGTGRVTYTAATP